MPLGGILLFIYIFIGNELTTKISAFRGKHIYYLLNNRTTYMDSGSSFRAFTTDSNVLIDLGMDHYVTAILLETERIVSVRNNSKLGVDLLGSTPHGSSKTSCIVGIALNIVSNCKGYSRFIRIRVTQPLTIKKTEIQGHAISSELFVGCYEYAGETNDSESNLNLCLSKCFGNLRPFGGIMNGTCHCLEDLFALKLVSLSLCYLPCTLLGQLCGRSPHIPIYFTDHLKLESDTFVEPWCLENATKCQKCPLGLGGISCNVKNCSHDNGGCQEDGCRTIDETLIHVGVCECREGYMPVFLEACQDIDECKRRPCFTGAICLNTIGSYRCQCQPGFTKILEKCEDVNECLSSKSRKCQTNTTKCSNTIGSFECKCLPGLERLDSVSCKDINECARVNLCDKLTTTCKNMFGSFSCNCLVGFKEHNNYQCRDIDECGTKADTCDDRTSSCHNTQGSYDCFCLTGYMEVTKSICADVEECATMRHSCNNVSTICRNTVGSYECWCRSGLTRIDMFSCVDIDECANSHPNLCEKRTTRCNNVWGSYKCRCLIGYKALSQYECRDINECDTALHSCGTSSICINSPGSFHCLCGPGLLAEVYKYTTLCQDIDECNGDNLCSEGTSVCINYHGGYSCQCKIGYGHTSEDLFNCVLADPPNSTTTEIYDDYTTETETGVSYQDNLARIVMYLIVVGCGFLGLIAFCFINYVLTKFPWRRSSGSGSSLGSF